MHPDAALSEMAAHKDRPRDEVGRLSSNRRVLSVELKSTRRELSSGGV